MNITLLFGGLFGVVTLVAVGRILDWGWGDYLKLIIVELAIFGSFSMLCFLEYFVLHPRGCTEDATCTKRFGRRELLQRLVEAENPNELWDVFQIICLREGVRKTSAEEGAWIWEEVGVAGRGDVPFRKRVLGARDELCFESIG
jgi:hypothetical protein